MRLEFARSWVQFPAGLRCVFSSDPVVNSFFVGAEREEKLIKKEDALINVLKALIKSQDNFSMAKLQFSFLNIDFFVVVGLFFLFNEIVMH